ncbi:cereblon family protein [Thermodesulfobacteriota bacterium]
MFPTITDGFNTILPTRDFRVPAERENGNVPEATVENEAKEKTSAEEYILCRQCLQVITSPSERITVQGSHAHTFSNPHGMVYNIGCFRSVRGCGYIGPAAEEFTWFRGFSWRIAVCSMCLTHLGWLFESRGNESFNGLILDRLVNP